MNSLILPLLCLVVAAPQTSWAKDSSHQLAAMLDNQDDASSQGVSMQLLPWVSTEEDRQDVLRVFKEFSALRISPLNPGYYFMNVGDQHTILSNNFPNLYPPSDFQKWIFEVNPGVMISIHCPVIRIQPSRRCRKDKFVTFAGRRFRRGTRRCGRINNFKGSWEQKAKVVFKSNFDDRRGMGFCCHVTAHEIPTTTTSTSTTSTSTTSTSTTTTSTTTSSTTTTTLMPGCHHLLVPIISVLISDCSSLDPALSNHCECTQCNGTMVLKCWFCTLCDFDLFAAYQFTPNILLEPHFNCSYPMDVSGMFYLNAPQIRGLRFCVEENMTHITFPYADLTNLSGLYYQDCSNSTNRSCLYDPCSTEELCCHGPGAGNETMTSPRMDPVYPVYLPSSSDTPGLLELFLADVNITLDNTTLNYPSLERLCVNSHEAEVEPWAFSNLTALQQVFVELCQANLMDGTFAINSNNLSCLEIIDLCTHLMETNSISLDAGCNPMTTTVSVTTEDAFLQYVPKCPFMTLLNMDCVHLNWNSQTECRACGYYWLWSLTSSRLASVTGQCYDALSNTVTSLHHYVTNNALRPSCNFPVVPC